MRGKNIYIAQFGSGTSINLLPLAAGQLFSRLKADPLVAREFSLQEILFHRPDDPSAFADELQDVAVFGLSCFLWNRMLSLKVAEAVRARFPDALIILGGPSIPHVLEEAEPFLQEHRYINLISKGEGEDLLVQVCHRLLDGQGYAGIPGLIYRNDEGEIIDTGRPVEPSLETLPSPYLDGTFDVLYHKYKSEVSGIIWETNRGCPYRCSFCTWGNLPSHQIRDRRMEDVRREVEWIGRNGVRYVAMSDANFGIRKRDVEVIHLLAECKKKYGVPDFLSVSWVKNSSDKVLEISQLLKDAGIGFRVTLSLQSLDLAVIKAANRINIKRDAYDRIKQVYRNQRLYSYTELILGLPLESYESYIAGIEQSLSDSAFDQLYIYPCLLFPNTEIASLQSRAIHGIRGRLIPNRYTKSKERQKNEEVVEIVVGTDAMPPERWVEAFTVGYFTLGVHDDRLGFFVFWYLKKERAVRIRTVRGDARRVSGPEPLLQEARGDCARRPEREVPPHRARRLRRHSL